MKSSNQILSMFLSLFVIFSALIAVSPWFAIASVCTIVLWISEKEYRRVLVQHENALHDQLHTKYEQIIKSQKLVEDIANSRISAMETQIAGLDAEVTKLRAAHSMKFGAK